MSQELKGTKKIVYWAILCLFPLLILIAIELILRLCGYGYNFSMVVKDEKHVGYLYLNPDISKKYFTIQDNATLGLYEPFREKKNKDCYRIFVLGESTALGFPYSQSGSFHRLLQYRLQRTFPYNNIEIINLSLTAVNSWTVLDFSKQLIKYEPDAVLIYLGHNEYYGAMGIGSTSNMGNSYFLNKLILLLKDYRIFQFISSTIQKFKKVDVSKTDLTRNLMERMVSGQLISRNSPEYKAGLVQFEKNLTSIFEIFRKNKIEVYCSNLVSNYKDQRPFESSSPKNREEWNDLYEKSFQFFKMQKMDSAHKYIVKANELDSNVAKGNFLLGQIALKLGDADLARKEFIKAKDNDLLRFRAPEEINEIIEKKSKIYKNVNLVDSKTYFETQSDQSIIGRELVTEHLHPNLKGYWLISLAFYNALKESGQLSKDWIEEISDKKIFKELPVTKIDSLYGAYQVQLLREKWPFNEKFPPRDTSGITFEEKVAGGLAVKTLTWKDAVNVLMNYYLNNGRYKDALKLFESQIPDMPFDKIKAYSTAISLCEKANEYGLATYYGIKVFQLSPGFQYAQSLFINYLKNDEPEKAIRYIDYCQKNNHGNVNLSPLRATVQEIIKLKENLNADSTNSILSRQIGQKYLLFGNKAAATKYLN